MQMADLSLRTFHALSDLLSPLYYNNLKPIAPRDPGEPGIARTLTFRSYISKDARWAYMYNGPTLKCFPITSQSGESRSPRSQSQLVLSTGTYNFQHSIITCVTELALTNSKANGITKLLVGLNCGVGGGALVIYDPIIGRPIKWIATPAAISSVLVLSNSEESGYTRPFYSEAMVAMVGIAAVGCYGGHVYLIDLGLDDIDLTPSSHSFPDEGKIYKLTFVDPHEEYVAPKRRAAAAKKLLICVDFKNQDEYTELEDYDPSTFYYSAGEEEVVKISKESVCIACMEYVPDIGSLVLGFNFGGFQIWRVDNASLEYTSALNPTRTPVHSICFQLPVDDPKNFCYLWVLYGTAITEMQVAKATFYALFYEQRDEGEHFGPTFHSLQSCVPRLMFDLQDFYLPASENESAESLEANDSLLDTTAIQRFAVRPLRMWAQTDNLIFFTWECTRNDAYMLGIFDLNQWYSAQTPVRLNCVPENQLNPFWTAINFTIPFDVERGHFPIVYDVQVIPKTLERWENPHNRQDVHLFPASVTFQACCVSSIGTFVFEHFGIQEKLLRLIQKDGYHLLAEPAMLRQLCENYGVAPFLVHGSGEDLNENDVDRLFIFTALLESRRPSLIIQIANRWIDGALANLGCTLDLILKWIKGYNHTLRLYVEEHWSALLSIRGDLPPETTHCLNYSNFMWNQINGLLMTLARHEQVYDNMIRSDEVEYLQFALDKLVPYSAALLMMHRAGILPATNNFDVMMLLEKMCAERRTNVRTALLDCEFLPSEDKNVPQLLIDSLLRVFQETCIHADSAFDQEEFLYPPPHPIFIFNMLLGKWTPSEMKIISRVIFYFILDITHLLDMSDMTTPQSTLRGDFSSILKLTLEEQNEVLHLWYIDHGDFDKALLFLCNGDRIRNHRELSWANACVLLAAQGCEEPVLHILKHFCFPKARKLYVNLLCLNESTLPTTLIDILLSDLFSEDQDVLIHCFEVLEARGLLHDFIASKSSHATPRLQDGLIAYLRSKTNSFANDSQLLLCYMTHGDDKNAEDHFERMKVQWSDSRVLLSRDQEDWAIIRSQTETYMSGRRGNFIRNFLGYEQAQETSIRRPLKLETKMIPSTPVRHAPPHLKRLALESTHENGNLGPNSPLRHYSPPKQDAGFRSPSAATATNKSFVDLDVLLRTPKISQPQTSRLAEDTEEFSTPTGVHGILRSRNASTSKFEEADLSVRFVTDKGIVSVGDQSSDLNLSDDTSEASSEDAATPSPMKADSDSWRKSKTPEPGMDEMDEERDLGVIAEVSNEEMDASTVNEDVEKSFVEHLPEDGLACSANASTASAVSSLEEELGAVAAASYPTINIVPAEPSEPVAGEDSFNLAYTEPDIPASLPTTPPPKTISDRKRKRSKSTTPEPKSKSITPESKSKNVTPELKSKAKASIESSLQLGPDDESSIIRSSKTVRTRTRARSEELGASGSPSPLSKRRTRAASEIQDTRTPKRAVSRSSKEKYSPLEPDANLTNVAEPRVESSGGKGGATTPSPNKVDRRKSKSKTPEAKGKETLSEGLEIDAGLKTPSPPLGRTRSASTRSRSRSIEPDLDQTSASIASTSPRAKKSRPMPEAQETPASASIRSPQDNLDEACLSIGDDLSLSTMSSSPKTPPSTRSSSRIRHKSKSTTPDSKRGEGEDLEEGDKRRVTRSLSKKLGLDESIHNMSLETSLSRERRRSTRARSEEPDKTTSSPPSRKTRARSEVPETSVSISKRQEKAKSEEPYTTVFDAFEADLPTGRSSRKSKAKSSVKLETSDYLDELDLSVCRTPKKRTRSETKESDTSPASVSLSDAVKQYDLRKERSKSPTSPAKTRSQKRVFGYAPSLSIVVETSDSLGSTLKEEVVEEEDVKPEPSILAATILEEKPKKRPKVKKEPKEEEDDSSSTRSDKSTRSGSGPSSRTRRSTRSRTTPSKFLG